MAFCRSSLSSTFSNSAIFFVFENFWDWQRENLLCTVAENNFCFSIFIFPFSFFHFRFSIFIFPFSFFHFRFSFSFFICSFMKAFYMRSVLIEFSWLRRSFFVFLKLVSSPLLQRSTLSCLLQASGTCCLKFVDTVVFCLRRRLLLWLITPYVLYPAGCFVRLQKIIFFCILLLRLFFIASILLLTDWLMKPCEQLDT